VNAARVRSFVASGPMPAAVVVDVGWVNGLAAVRSLGRLGVPVVAVDYRRSAIGFRSRYCVPVICPDPGIDEAGFVRVLTKLGEALDRPAPIFPTHDDVLNALAQNAGAFGGAYLCPFPSWERLEQIQSKRYQLERAEAAGVPVPRTAYPGSGADALVAAAELGYPLLVKPSEPAGFRRRFRKQAFRCEDVAALESAYAAAEPHAPMLQELVPGGDDALYTLGSYIAENGEVLGLFSGRKLRQTPPIVGTCRVGEAVWVDEVVELGVAMLRAIDFRGISQVEFKRDQRDGRFKLMEVNPRLWQWHGLAAACGVDLPRIAYWDLLNARLPAVRTRCDGLRWATTLMKGRPPAVQRPPYVDSLIALDDPLPAVVQAGRMLLTAAR
jgi:D-aspartate ligase